MPLSADQVQSLKCADTEIEYEQNNPKQPGTKSQERYEQYKSARHVRDVKAKGATWADMTSDFDKGFLKIKQGAEMTTVRKRLAGTGSPEKMAEARAKGPFRYAQGADLQSMPAASFPNEAVTERVEMSHATIATLRAMMREEVHKGVEDTEKIVELKVSDALRPLREELAAQKESYQRLEQRVAELENKSKDAPHVLDDAGEVDKSIVVIGGFGEMGADDAEKFVNDAIADVDGFQEVFAINPDPKVVLARFTSPTHARKFLRTQKRRRNFKDAGLWASENRYRAERKRAKILSKTKKFFIELHEYDPKDVIINYATFRAHVRVSRKLHHVVSISEEGAPVWEESEYCAQDVKEAIQSFIEELDE